jgi:hypothetical protein
LTLSTLCILLHPDFKIWENEFKSICVCCYKVCSLGNYILFMQDSNVQRYWSCCIQSGTFNKQSLAGVQQISHACSLFYKQSLVRNKKCASNKNVLTFSHAYMFVLYFLYKQNLTYICCLQMNFSQMCIIFYRQLEIEFLQATN